MIRPATTTNPNNDLTTTPATFTPPLVTLPSAITGTATRKVSASVHTDEPNSNDEAVNANEPTKADEARNADESIKVDEPGHADESINVNEPGHADESIICDESLNPNETINRDETLTTREPMTLDDSANAVVKPNRQLTRNNIESVKLDTLKLFERNKLSGLC
jgi:hypothetical protein